MHSQAKGATPVVLGVAIGLCALVLFPSVAQAGRCSRLRDVSGRYLCKGRALNIDKPISISAAGDKTLEVLVAPGFGLNAPLSLENKTGSVRYTEISGSDTLENVDITISSSMENISIDASGDIDFTTMAELSSESINIESFGEGSTNLTIGGTLRVDVPYGFGNVVTQTDGRTHTVSLLPTAVLKGGRFGVTQLHGVDALGQETAASCGKEGDTIAHIDGRVRTVDRGVFSRFLGELDDLGHATADYGYFISTGRATDKVSIDGAGTLAGGAAGLALYHRGTGDIAIDFGGDSTARYGDAVNIVSEDPAVRTTLRLSGVIDGGRDAIRLDSAGDATIRISGTLRGRRNAILDGDGATTVLIGKDAAAAGADRPLRIVGAIKLGGGTDRLWLDETADVAGVPVFDGGHGVDTLYLDGRLSGSSIGAGSGADKRISNWENVTIGSSGALTVTGDLNADIDNAGGLGLAPTVRSARLEGDFVNAGVIRLDLNPSPGQRLIVTGDYRGDNGTVRLNTVWNAPGDSHGGDSRSDVLEILGDAAGVTRIVPVSTDGRERIIDGDIRQLDRALATVPVVTVAGGAPPGAFTGTARTTGAAQVQLTSRNGGKGGKEYYWTMRAREADVPPSSEFVPTASARSDHPATGAVIYAPSVSGYVQMAVVDRELVSNTLGDVQARREAGDRWWDDNAPEKRRAWGRIVAAHHDHDSGKRFGYSGSQTLVQIGRDFGFSANAENGSRRRGGAYFVWGRRNTEFSDDRRAVDGIISGDTHTGTGISDAVGLGGYATYSREDGGYLDLVGQVSHLHNRTTARDQVKAGWNGWALALSAQVGRPYPLFAAPVTTSALTLEPRAQLILQRTRLDGFDDGTRHVITPVTHSLLGRLGARLAYEPNRSGGMRRRHGGVVTLSMDVGHEFIAPKAVAIGADRVRDSYGDTWAKVGVGMELPFSRDGVVSADLTWRHGFGGERGEEIRGMIGIGYSL